MNTSKMLFGSTALALTILSGCEDRDMRIPIYDSTSYCQERARRAGRDVDRWSDNVMACFKDDIKYEKIVRDLAKNATDEMILMCRSEKPFGWGPSYSQFESCLFDELAQAGKIPGIEPSSGDKE
jgi:hypothetical protein